MTEICTDCGKGHLELKACDGRAFVYKKNLVLPFPSDVEVPTCSSCGAWFVSQKLRNEVKQYLKVKHNL